MPHRIVVALAVAALTPATAAAQSPVQQPAPAPTPPVNAAPAPAKDPNAVGQGVKVDTPAGKLTAGPRVSASLRVARAFWETQPHGCKTISVYDAVLPNEFGGAIVPGVSCAMWIGHGFFTGHAADDRVATCDEIVRQYGYLTGARHSLHPRSIMNPVTSATVWGCDHRFLRKPARNTVFATR
jgi:hypothetical protein